MKVKIVLFLLFGVTIGQAQWITLNNTITQSLNGIYMRNDQEGWVVGNEGTVYHLTDKGINWERENGVSSDDNLNDVCFVSNTLGWCVGTDKRVSNGKVYKRTPQGLWELKSIPASSELLGITCLNGSNDNSHLLWIVGLSSRILHSSNSGSNYSSLPSNTGAAYRDVAFTDQNTGWIVGNLGVIIRTSNGGFSWSDTLISKTKSRLNGLYFADNKHGWAVGFGGVIISTKDGGTSWSLQSSPTTSALNAITGIDGEHLIAVGENGSVIMTSNGGTTWKTENGLTGSLNDVAMKDTMNYWIVGANGINYYSEGTVKFGANPIVQNERLKVDTKRDISFVTQFNSTVNLDFSTDGVTWARLPSATAIVSSLGKYEWTIPPTPSTTCQLRLSSSKKPQLQMFSPTFTIFDGIHPEIVAIDTSNLKPQKGDSVVIQAKIIDNNPTINTLFYRQGGATSFRSKPMASIGDNQYRATILAREGEAFAIDERGLEFYLKSVDTSPDFNESTTRVMFLPIRITSRQHDILRSDPGDREIYQMITIPYKLNDASISSVLENDLGSYDPHKWRLWFWRNDDDGYGEFTKVDIGQFTQGRSFWLAAVKDKLFSDAGQSYKPDTVNIELRFGWNQIGHPFAFSVLKQEIFAATKDTAGISAIYGYNDQWQPVPLLEPGKGYFIKNSAGDRKSKTLKIPPIAKTSATVAPAKSPDRAGGWKIKLRARIERFVDDYNLVGVDRSAAEEWDNLDQPEPPPAVGKYVSLYFPRQDWRSFPDLYTTDFRPPIADGEIWTFVVATNITNSAAEINFKWVESIPEEFQVYLLDEDISFTQNLRQNPAYSFPTASKPMRKTLKLAVGKPDFFQRHNLQINQVPRNYELAQNFPNPFNPATAIRFGLPAAGAVTLKIFNVLGEEIAVLLDNEQKPAGYHVQIWNGRDRHGHAVPSGVYFYRITAGAFTATKKMLFVK